MAWERTTVGVAAFNMPFAAFDEYAGRDPFRWAELAQSAPRVLEARMSDAAVDALKADALKADAKLRTSRRVSREDCL